MATYFGAIADDFTGATDLAGLLARSGVHVSLRIGIPSEPPANTAAFEIIALKSRTAPVEEAINEAKSALNWLQVAGAKRFFWKYCSTFDSTENGNIGPVAEALMRKLSTDQTIYCPAFPENGRSIYMGNLFVGRQPLSESPMKDHPLTPMRDSNLMRLLSPQVTGSVDLVDRQTVDLGPEAIADALSQFRDGNLSHVIVDAVANDDLFTIAEACKDMPLLTGGSAVAMPLPMLYLQDGVLSAESNAYERPITSDATVVLSGSCSAMTNAQVAHYLAQGRAAYQLDPLQLAKDGPEAALSWLASQDFTSAPLVYATARPESVRAAQDILGVEAAGELIEQTLASCAQTAIDLGARRFIVAGGETSGAVTKALGADQLDVSQEIAPGVPWCFCKSNGHQIAVTLKSGNFGSEAFFSEAQEKLNL